MWFQKFMGGLGHFSSDLRSSLVWSLAFEPLQLGPGLVPKYLVTCGTATKPIVKYVPKCGKAGQRVPRSVLGSWVRAGQRAWLQPGGCALMGCRCPISDGQGWAKAQPGHARTRLKRIKNRAGILDIMGKESYLLQGTIYSNRQTIVSYYNRNKIGQ